VECNKLLTQLPAFDSAVGGSDPPDFTSLMRKSSAKIFKSI
jgi:hypothetical protein